MAQPTEQASAAPTTPATVTATAPASTENNLSTTGTGATALTAADMKALTPAQQDELTQAIFDKIPRDNSGKALIPPEEPPVAVVEPVVEPEPEIVTDPVPEPEPVVTDPPVVDPELEPDPEPGKLVQHRARANNTFDDMVLRRYKNAQIDGKPLNMEQCIAAEKAAQGIVAPPQTEQPQGKTVETAQTELAVLREQRKAAKITFDADAEETLTSQIEDKIGEIRDIKDDIKARQQAEQYQAQSAYQQSMIQAVTLYPDLAKPDSEIAKAKDAIHAALVASNDPAVHAPDYPVDLGRRAAKVTSTAPYLNGKTPTAVKTVPKVPVQPAKPVAPLLSATARTTPTGKVQTTAAVISGLKGNQRGLDELTDALNAKMGR